MEMTAIPLLADAVPMLHREVLHLHLFHKDLVITAWKLIGYLGTGIFASRWFVQMYASRKQGKVTMPRTFWVMSVMGSSLLLAYFIFGKNDSVGVLSNLFPAFVSFYNLILDVKHARRGDD